MTLSRVKLADVAKAAGVSQGTASNVFSRPEIVREEVRERVMGVARELGYRGPDIKGRLLRAGKVNAIGVATIDRLAYFFDDPWARAMMTEIGRVCDATGTGLSLVSARNQQRLAWNIGSALVDGFILLCVEGEERLVDLTRRRGLPFVALAMSPRERSIASIGVDNVGGGAAAARHLAALGHRHIGVLAIGTHLSQPGPMRPDEALNGMGSTSADRWRGYLDGLGEFGIGSDAISVHMTHNDKATVEVAMQALFSSAEPPTALLAMADHAALIAMEWLSANGLSVPDDVSIVGFDDVPEAALSAPGLTTVAQPMAEIAQKAVSAILAEEPPEGQHILPVRLVTRGSTRAPAARR